jgi:hypothetical protein
MTQVRVVALNVYPVKGCQSIPVEEAEVGPFGLGGDRGFALWADDKLVEQVETPQTAAIGARWNPADRTLEFRHAEHGSYLHELRESGESRAVEWVLDKFDASDQGDEVADWLSAAVGKEVRLIHADQPWQKNLPLDEFALLHGTASQRFQSASPVSLSNSASLADLNERLESPAPMDRFRMNLVVDGLDAWAEDDIVAVSCGALRLLRVTHCERCPITTTDQQTGERTKSDLLKVLRKHRYRENRFASGLMFGAYMAVDRPGILKVGDRLDVEF